MCYFGDILRKPARKSASRSNYLVVTIDIPRLQTSVLTSKPSDLAISG